MRWSACVWGSELVNVDALGASPGHRHAATPLPRRLPSRCGLDRGPDYGQQLMRGGQQADVRTRLTAQYVIYKVLVNVTKAILCEVRCLLQCYLSRLSVQSGLHYLSARLAFRPVAAAGIHRAIIDDRAIAPSWAPHHSCHLWLCSHLPQRISIPLFTSPVWRR